MIWALGAIARWYSSSVGLCFGYPPQYCIEGPEQRSEGVFSRCGTGGHSHSDASANTSAIRRSDGGARKLEATVWGLVVMAGNVPG